MLIQKITKAQVLFMLYPMKYRCLLIAVTIMFFMKLLHNCVKYGEIIVNLLFSQKKKKNDIYKENKKI